MLDDCVSVIMSTADPLQERTQRALKHLARSDVPYELILLNRNHEWTTGTIVNQGIAASVGGYVAFLCDDCFIEPEALRMLRDALQDPEVGVAGALLQYPNGIVQHAGGKLRIVPTDNYRNRKRIWAVNLKHLGQWEPLGAVEAKDVDFVTGAFMMTRRDVLDAIGWYAVECGLDWGDVDFCLRARQGGYRNRFVPSARAIHIEAATRGVRTGPVDWFLSRWASSPLIRLPDDSVVSEVAAGGS